MAQSIEMPALGESVNEGTVSRWLKNVGDTVQADEPLLEVSTDKVDTEVPSPVSGVLTQILVNEDETVNVGTVLAYVGEPGEAPAAPAAVTPAPAPVAAAPAAPIVPATPVAAPAAPAAAPTSGTGTPIEMPALGESVTEGTVSRWLKHVGDTVAVDEPLLEVSTDKVDTEVPSPAAGVVTQILAAEDDTVAVGAVLAYIGQPGSAPVASAPVASAPVAAAPVPAPVPVAAPPAPPAPTAPAPVAPVSTPMPPAPTPVATVPATAAAAVTGEPYATPLVRKLATDGGVDLASIHGTGVGGRIRRQDVLQAIATATPVTPAVKPAASKALQQLATSPLRGTTEKMTHLRKVVASRMVEALQTTAQLTTVVEVDVTKIAQLRARAKESFKAREGTNLTFLPFMARAAVEALAAFPKINASIVDGEIVYHGVTNLGIAVDTERGLVVPVIKDADTLDIAGLSHKIADVAGRTRDNKVGPDELIGGTFTITNTGSGGALFDTPIVPQPQVAILGTGTIVKRPVVVKDDNGQEAIAIRSMFYLMLSYDHRLVDGADAARYLTAVKRRLEEGNFESELGL